MEFKVDEIRKRAKEILGDNKIKILEDEKDTIETLQKIANTDETNLKYEMKTLEDIEEYLKYKEKRVFAQIDTQILKNLAKELREQEIRLTDSSNPPLFMIKNSLDENIYFLTRESLKRYREHNKNSGKTIEIPSSNSQELASLLDIIKRNF